MRASLCLFSPSQNILIDHRGNVKLSDFGIMKEFENESLSRTFTGKLR